MSKQTELREEITNQLVKALEAGTIPWRSGKMSSFDLDDSRGIADQWEDNLAAPDYEAAQFVVEGTGVELKYGNRCAYVRPKPKGSWPDHKYGDYIMLPPPKQFFTMGDYYETIFHELCHWTEVRRNWTGSYAEGELIAEIGGCYLVQELNVPQSTSLDNHAAYLASWLVELGNDSDFIFRASREASQVVTYVLNFSRHSPVAETAK